MIWIKERQGALRFKVRVLTRASRTEMAGAHGDALKIRLAASPVEGAANAELITLLAKQLRLPKSAISIVRGLKGRDKVLEAAGATRDQLSGLI